ncbi:PH domain-containing protein [Streptomyces sp. NPDC047974]|uniref:PH domain-containing protein n=1 Tax=Streptomyces sp. NPDC047974 TaxID=3154343 RepID=UPI0033D9DE5A
MLAAVYKVSSMNGFRVGWQGIPIYLALSGIAGRIASCKVILSDDTLTVVNPLRTHHVPKAAIREVSVGDEGTLEIHINTDRPIASFAFGGSLVDRFKGSSDKAQRNIHAWLLSDRMTSTAPTTAGPKIHWTRCPSADACLVLCLVLSVVGAIWVSFTSG